MAKATVPVQFTPVDARKVEAALSRIQAQAKGVNFGGGAQSIEKLSRPLGKITGQANEFQKSLEASNARVLAFGASVAVINKLSEAFGALVSNTIKVEATFAKINTVLGGTQKQLQDFGNGVFRVAQQTGKSFDEVAEGALELARQGLSVEESLGRVETALKLVRVTGIKSTEAVAGLTAAIKGFEGAGLTVVDVADKLSQVDTKFAVSTEDLINGLERSAASARVAGVSFDELLGIITTVQERTQRGGAVIGNAFKTIFARLGRTDTLIALQDLGISVLDAEGNVRGAIPLFEELAVELDKIGLKSVEAGDIIQKVAGVRQRDILISLVEDLNSGQSQFAKSLQVSAGAAGALDAKNAQLNDTLESFINNLTVGGQKLASLLGEIGFTDAAKNILSSLSSVVNVINDILDGDSIGSNFAKGLIKSIGNILTGPGLAFIGAVLGKLFLDLVKFGSQSLKQILGINKAAQQQSALQQSVLQTLFQNEVIQREILKLEGNKVAQEQLLLKIYNQQAAALARVQKAASTVTPGIFAAGFRGGESGVTRKGKAADGYITAEARDVSRGVGGAPANSRVVSIPNFAFGGGKRGTMVANTSEYIVPNFAGGGDAIFNRDMVRSMGLPAGAKKINAAGGYIPNFAAPSLSNLTIGQIGRLKAGNTVKIDGKTLKAEDFGTTSEALKASGGLAPSLAQRKKSKKTTAKDYPFSAKGIIGVLSAFQGSTSKRATKRFSAMSPREKDEFQKILKDQNINPKSSITITDIQNSSLGKIKKNKLSTFRKDIDTSFAESLINFTSKLIQGAGIQGNDLSEFNDIVEKSQGNLFSTSVEGGIFESAIQLGTRNLEQIRSFLSTTGDEQTPFDFEEMAGNVVGKKFKEAFGFDSQLEKADAKRTVNSKALSTLIGKSLRDEAIKTKIFKASSGYIPNFAQSPLEDAISREQSAGLPISQIRINQSGKLRNSRNPMGLAVTNTRDEPTGAIPNFAKFNSLAEARASNLTEKQIAAGFGGKAAKDELLGLTNSANQASEALDSTMGKMFALSLAAGGLTSAFGEQEGAMGELTKGINEATTVLFGLSAINISPLGVFGKGGGGLKQIPALLKGAKTAAGALSLLKGLAGPVALGFTALNTALKMFTGKGIFQRLGETFGILANESQKAAQKINEAAKSLKPDKEGEDVVQNIKSIGEAIIKASIEAAQKESLGIDQGKDIPSENLRFAGILAEILPKAPRKIELPDRVSDLVRGVSYEVTPKYDPEKGTITELGVGKKNSQLISERLQKTIFASAEEVIKGVESVGGKITQEDAQKVYDQQIKLTTDFIKSIGRGNMKNNEINKALDEFSLGLAGLFNKYLVSAEQALVKENPNLRISELSGRIDDAIRTGEFKQFEGFKLAGFRGNSSRIPEVISSKDSLIGKQMEMQIKLAGNLNQLEIERLQVKKDFLDLEIKANQENVKRGADLAKEVAGLVEGKAVSKEQEDALIKLVISGGSYEEVLTKINKLIPESSDLYKAVGEELKNIIEIYKQKNLEAGIDLNIQAQILEIQKKQAKMTLLERANQERRNSLETLTEEVPARLADNLESSLASTFDNLATGAYDSLGDAFLNVALDFGRALQQEISRAAAKSLVESFTSSGVGSGIFQGIGNFFKGFNSGGLVKGGSGVRDDVPAKLTGGEYVIKKSAVQKYGLNFLENLNSGGVKGMQTGGFFVPGTRGQGEIKGKENLLAFAQQEYTSGATDVIRASGSGAYINLEDQSLKLTTFGRFRDSPARRALKDAQKQAFDLYVARIEEEKRVKEANKAKRDQFKNAVIGSFASAAVFGAGSFFQNMGAPKIGSTSAFQASANQYSSQALGYNVGTTSPGTYLNFKGGASIPINLQAAPTPSFNLGAGQAYTPSFNYGRSNGGSMSGATNAMLMGGEYVMSPQAAGSIGRQTLDDINNMRIPPMMMANGGAFGNITSDSSSGSTGSKADIGAVNIEINMDKDGSAAVSADSEGNTDPTRTKEFARKVKEVVVNVIAEEKRVSGSLFTRKK